jgi:hypothetical protein
MRCFILLSALLLQAQTTTGFFVSQAPPRAFSRIISSTTSLNVASSKVLSDIDIMCIMNAADLCSYYDQCDIEEREALLNRLDEQTDMLAQRIAMMSCLTRHLKTGDHMHLEEDETAKLKATILDTIL